MSARHEDPLRDYRAPADFLRKALGSSDPDEVRAAVQRFVVLPHLADAARAGVLRATDVGQQDALDVIAIEKGYRGWRDLRERLSFLFPPGSPEARKGLQAAHMRDERSLHDELLRRVWGWTSEWTDVRVDLDWTGGNEPIVKPAPMIDPSTGVAHVPDLTGYKDGVLHIVEVKRAEAFTYPKTERQLCAFAKFAQSVGAHFELVVDDWGEEPARKFLARYGIAAELRVEVAWYQHDIYDAIAADGWRDFD